MRDHKPVAIAMVVGSLALAANAAAAVVAMSATSRPEAMGFGVVGLMAAFIGLVMTMLWARRDGPEPEQIEEPRPMHRRVFTPWVAPVENDELDSAPIEEALLAEEEEAHRAALALAARPAPALPPASAANDRVVYLRDWIRAHPAAKRQAGR